MGGVTFFQTLILSKILSAFMPCQRDLGHMFSGNSKFHVKMGGDILQILNSVNGILFAISSLLDQKSSACSMKILFLIFHICLLYQITFWYVLTQFLYSYVFLYWFYDHALIELQNRFCCQIFKPYQISSKQKKVKMVINFVRFETVLVNFNLFGRIIKNFDYSLKSINILYSQQIDDGKPIHIQEIENVLQVCKNY